MEHAINFSFPADSEGFISQKCPSCRRHFKVRVKDKGRYSLHYCPHCGSGSEEGFLTDEQKAYVHAIGAEQIGERVRAELARTLGQIMGGGFVPVSEECQSSIIAHKPTESDTPMARYRSRCCREPVKHHPADSPQYCVVCGKPEWVQGQARRP